MSSSLRSGVPVVTLTMCNSPAQEVGAVRGAACRPIQSLQDRFPLVAYAGNDESRIPPSCQRRFAAPLPIRLLLSEFLAIRRLRMAAKAALVNGCEYVENS